jgi:hypothetical protein
VVGKFKDTISENINSLSILRLDCDYYEPTMLILERYYSYTSIGGYVIIDDFNNEYLNCKEAVMDFRKKYNITNPIINEGGGCVYWIV